MKKTLDCLAMKDAVQARLIQDMEGLNMEEKRNAIRDALAASAAPIGDIWRALTEGRGKVVRVAEGHEVYPKK